MLLNSVARLQEFLLRVKIPCQSFFKRYFNTNSLITAIIFSLPIYISVFEVNLFTKTLITISAISFLYLFFYKKQSFFQFGFFTGILWFWWIGLSFRYYNLSWMIPFVILFIGIGYGFIFFVLNYIFSKFERYKIFYISLDKILWVVFLVYGFKYIRPFTFDWLRPQIILVNSFFPPFKLVFLAVIIAVLLFKKNKILSLAIILATFFYPVNRPPKAPLKIKLVTTHVPQNLKWKKNYIPIEIKNNFSYIKKAISEKYQVVVLPESAFPLFLNLEPEILFKLIKLSKKITIITGALHYKNKKYYNSTYIFENGKLTILDKHELVPFGEYIPLPFFQKQINELFFGSASDYSTSSHFGIFKIKNIKFINAICYEATIEKLYTLKPTYIMAITNDAWFMPSIEPVLQKMLIKLFAYEHDKVVYHAINGYKSYIID